MRNWISKITILIGIIAIVAIAEYFILKEKKENHEITLYGNVDVRLVDIGFRVSGKVVQLFFEEGDVVKEGELLAILDKTPYDSALEEAIAASISIEAALKN